MSLEVVNARTHRPQPWLKRSTLVRSLLLGLIPILATTALCPNDASARLTRPYQESFFHSSSEREPSALAVDQSTGEIYASDGGKGGIEVFRFDANGAPSDFTAGPDAGTNALTELGYEISGIAVDNSGSALSGNIYIALIVETPEKQFKPEIKVFSSTGEALGVLDGSGTPEGKFGGVCGLTVDPVSGDLYIGQRESGFSSSSRIWRYEPASPSGSLDDADYAIAGIGVGGACDLSLSSGYVYTSRENQLRKYPMSAFSAAVPTLATPEPILEDVTDVASDPKTGEVYADQGSHVTVLDPATDSPSYTFGAHAYFTGSEAVAVTSAATGSAAKVYVGDERPGSNVAGEIDVFGPQENAPVISHPLIAGFGSEGTPSSSFLAMSQLAFHQADGKLYGVDGGLPGIYGFDTSGSPFFSGLSGFSALTTASAGEKPGLAVDNSGLSSDGNVYFVSQATDLLYGFDHTGAPLSGFPVDTSVSPGSPNGSPKELCGAAVDSAGHVWVSNSATRRILEYSSAGASLPGTVSTVAQGVPCSLAFDSEDNLYATTNGGVWRYTAASSYTSMTLVDNAGPANGIAVDPGNDDLFVTHADWIDKYDASGSLLEEFTPEFSGVQGVALDGINGDIYVSGRAQIHALSGGELLPDLTIGLPSGITNVSTVLKGTIGAQGLAIADCRFEYVPESVFRVAGFSDLNSGGSASCTPAAAAIPVDTELHQVSVSVSGLARNTAYRFRLVASNANGESATNDGGFETIGPPLVETTGSPMRTKATARLDSRVDPKGAEASYYFEYGTQGPCDTNPCVATKAVSAGSGNEFELVSAQLNGLEPDTTYHYRVLADNGNFDGPVGGADMTFKTFADEAPLSHGHLPGPVGSDRAWELVSAPDTSGNPVGVSFAPAASSISTAGDRVVYGVAGGTPQSETGTFATRLFAERTPAGWSTKSIYPHRDEANGVEWLNPGGPADLSTMVAENFQGAASGEFSVWKLTPGATSVRLYAGADSANTRGGFLAVSDDASRTLITLRGPVDPEHPSSAPGVQHLYDISSGTPHLIDLLPDGDVPTCGVVQGTNSSGLPDASKRSSHWVSADGSIAFFPSQGNSCGGPQRLYLREISAGSTKLISGSPLSGPNCDAFFIRSTSDAAFFYTQSRLTVDDSAPSACAGSGGGANGDVYRYDLGSGTLDCITCVIPGLEADVTFGVNPSQISEQIGIAENGSRIYFTARERLLPGAAAKLGVYRLNVASGELAYVGAFGFLGDSGRSFMTSDGAVVAFSSSSPSLNALGGQQNGGGVQYYRYDDRDRSLICVSCPADGEQPRGPVESTRLIGGPGANTGPLSGDGEDYAFITSTSLVGADQNTAGPGQNPDGGMDVYEWREGRLLLVSDGLTNWPAGEVPEVAGITPSGRDIFFTAAVQLTQDALDGYKRLYDARIDGGFEFPPPPKPCPLEVCQGTPKGTPEEQAPGSEFLTSDGNAAPSPRTRCPKAKVRRKGRCVARHEKHARKPTYHKRIKHKRRAGR